jgi:hypothetical protein
MIAQAKSDASDAVFRLRVATHRDLHTITLVVPSEGGHFPVSILSDKLNRIHATRVEAFPVQHSRLAVREEPLCDISEDFGSFPFLTSQKSTRLPSLNNSSRGLMNSAIENTSVSGPQVLTMMPCGMNRSWIRWRLTVAPGVGENSRKNSAVSSSIRHLSL